MSELDRVHLVVVLQCLLHQGLLVFLDLILSLFSLDLEHLHDLLALLITEFQLLLLSELVKPVDGPVGLDHRTCTV